MPNRDVLAHERLERSEVLHPGFPEDSFASSVAVPPAVVLGLHFEDCGESPPAVVLREESRAKGDALARVGVDKVGPFDNVDGEPGNIDACKGETAGIQCVVGQAQAIGTVNLSRAGTLRRRC